MTLKAPSKRPPPRTAFPNFIMKSLSFRLISIISPPDIKEAKPIESSIVKREKMSTTTTVVRQADRPTDQSDGRQTVGHASFSQKKNDKAPPCLGPDRLTHTNKRRTNQSKRRKCSTSVKQLVKDKGFEGKRLVDRLIKNRSRKRKNKLLTTAYSLCMRVLCFALVDQVDQVVVMVDERNVNKRGWKAIGRSFGKCRCRNFFQC